MYLFETLTDKKGYFFEKQYYNRSFQTISLSINRY